MEGAHGRARRHDVREMAAAGSENILRKLEDQETHDVQQKLYQKKGESSKKANFKVSSVTLHTEEGPNKDCPDKWDVKTESETKIAGWDKQTVLQNVVSDQSGGFCTEECKEDLTLSYKQAHDWWEGVEALSRGTMPMADVSERKRKALQTLMRAFKYGDEGEGEKDEEAKEEQKEEENEQEEKEKKEENEEMIEKEAKKEEDNEEENEQEEKEEKQEEEKEQEKEEKKEEEKEE